MKKNLFVVDEFMKTNTLVSCERGAANRQQSNKDTTVNISRASWTKFVNTFNVQP